MGILMRRASSFHLLSIEIIELVLLNCQINDAKMLAERKYSKLCHQELIDYIPTSFCVASRLSVSFYRIARSITYRNISLEIPVYHKSLLEEFECDFDSDSDDHSSPDVLATSESDRDIAIGSFTPRLQDLFDIFYLNDSIVYDIHHVKLSFKRLDYVEEFDPADHATNFDPTISVLQYLAKHQKLRSISIRGITHAFRNTEDGYGMGSERDGMDWRVLPAEVQDPLLSLLQGPTLEKVELINWAHFPLSRLWLNGERHSSDQHTPFYPISRSKNIAFTLHHVSDDPSSAKAISLERSGFSPRVSPPNPLSITSLRLVQPTLGWNYTTACLLSTRLSRRVVESGSVQVPDCVPHPIQLHAIQELAIAIKDPRDGCVAMLLAECGEGLQRLELDTRSACIQPFHKGHDSSHLANFDLSQVKSLRHLTFRISPETPISWISALLKTLPPRDEPIHESSTMTTSALPSSQPLSISLYLDTRRCLKKPDPQRIYNIRSALSGLNWVLFVDSVLSLQSSRSTLSNPNSPRSPISANASRAPSPIAAEKPLPCDEGVSDSNTTIIVTPTKAKFDASSTSGNAEHFVALSLAHQASNSSVSTKIDIPTETARNGLSVSLGIEASSMKIGRKVYRVLDRDTSLVTLSNMGALEVFVVQPEDDC